MKIIVYRYKWLDWRVWIQGVYKVHSFVTKKGAMKHAHYLQTKHPYCKVDVHE